MNQTEESTRRVLLWATGRSLSSVFLKCLTFVNGVQILSEPYTAAILLGPERTVVADHGKQSAADLATNVFTEGQQNEQPVKGNRFKMAVESEVCTFKWAKEALEANYSDKNIVFCKDLGFAIDGKYDLIPNGFRHTFLIRHPHKVFLSWKKLVAQLLGVPLESFVLSDELHPTLFPPKRSYGELFDLMTYLKNHGDEPNPIIIDADDLQRNPDSILRQYFTATGMGTSYTESLLKWPAGLDAFDQWIAAKNDLIAGTKPGAFYDACIKSTCFLPPGPTPKREELSEDILRQVDYVWEYYREMYALRLQP